MIQNNIFGKDNKEVVNYLRSIGLNEKNYKQVDVAHMVDAINYMEWKVNRISSLMNWIFLF